MAQKLKQINDISIGDNLRKLRNAANLTQEQVVAQLQLRNLPTSRSVYSQIEAGTYNIRISELIALAEIFHTDFNTIFNGLTVSAKYSCGFPDPQVLPIIVVDRYLDYFTTIMEDRLWQVLAKPVFRWRNRSGLSMNADRAA